MRRYRSSNFPGRLSIVCLAIIITTTLAESATQYRSSGPVVSAPAVSHAFGDGPPLSSTGGFGEQTCRACHWENALNAGSAAVEIQGLPDRYVAGAKYEITVVLRHAEMKVAGFQLAARFDSGAMRGKQAGELRALDARTSVARNDTNSVSYIGHTRAGTALLSQGQTSWKFEWVAPSPSAGTVIFHVAGNAADDTNSEGGDYIYTRMAQISGG